MMTPSVELRPLDRLARDIRRQIALERALRMLAALSPWIGAGLVLSGLLDRMLRLGWSSGGLLGAALAIWVALVAARLAFRLPGKQEALFLWDARTGRKGSLASAWELERRPSLRPGEQLHYARTLRDLDAVQRGSGLIWPRPAASWAALPLAAALLMISGWQERAAGLERRHRLEEQAAEAKAHAGKIDAASHQLAELAGRAPDTEKAAAVLPAALQETARRMESLDPAGAAHLPGELEERAQRRDEHAQNLAKAGAARVSGEQLAQDLRDPAAQIDGRAATAVPAPLPGTEPLAKHEPLQPLEAAPPAPAPPQTPPASPPATAQESQPPVPGMAPSAPGQEPPPPGSVPVPGSAGLLAANLARRLGGEQTGAAPVPGLDAGMGGSELRTEAASAFPAQREERVEAVRSEQGQSRFRDVRSGEPRPEEARPAQDPAAAFEAVEEAVQNAQPLPAARRAQVERYFRGIRNSTKRP